MLLREMGLSDKFKKSFNYLLSKLPIQTIVDDLSKLKWDEGKSYDWAIIKKDNVHLVIRKYGTHFTVFFKNKYKITDNELIDDYFHTKYGCFTFDTDRHKVENYDRYVDYNFLDINNHIDSLIELIAADKIYSLWNSYSFKRPAHIDVKNVWNGGEDICSIDTFVFGCEELFGKYLELFAQTEMFEKVKTFKVGDRLSAYEITGVSTDLQLKTYGDPYYHGVGLSMKNTNFPTEKESFKDVYCLSRHYYEYVFPKPVLQPQ